MFRNHVLIHSQFVLFFHHLIIGGSVNDRKKYVCVCVTLNVLCARTHALYVT